jgi:hypothetical protein
VESTVILRNCFYCMSVASAKQGSVIGPFGETLRKPAKNGSSVRDDCMNEMRVWKDSGKNTD